MANDQKQASRHGEPQFPPLSRAGQERDDQTDHPRHAQQRRAAGAMAAIAKPECRKPRRNDKRKRCIMERIRLREKPENARKQQQQERQRKTMHEAKQGRGDRYPFDNIGPARTSAMG